MHPGLLLTEAERQRFADWLAHEAVTADGLATQMASIKTPDMLVKEFRMKALACKVVERMLRRTESMTVEKPGDPT